MIEALHHAMKEAVLAIKQWPANAVQILHHNDADGLSSAAILTRAFDREGYVVRRNCLEKPYPQIIHRIFEQNEGLIVFADFAGQIAPLIADLNAGRNLVLILDHHATQATDGQRLHHLNPELYGLKGDRDISASTVCYLFAQTFNPDNKDLAHLAVVGAVGDNFLDKGRLTEENRKAALQAQTQGSIRIHKKGSMESYHLATYGSDVAVPEMVHLIETLGAAGYYADGPELGIQCLLHGISDHIRDRFKGLENIRKAIFADAVRILEKGGLNQAPHLQWFHVEDSFSPMGVKMIGVFCQSICNLRFVDPQKYIAGFQRLPDEVPGFGSTPFNADKVSMRAPPFLAKKIVNGTKPGIGEFFPQATLRLGGFADGCHHLAAATIIGSGKAESLIAEMERILAGRG